MQIRECQVGDLLRLKSGGAIFRVVYRGKKMFTSYERLTMRSQNGQYRTFSERDASWKADIIPIHDAAIKNTV